MNVYFDNAATTKVRPEAAQAVMDMMTENYGNPSSTHRVGREAAKTLKAARECLARAIGAQPDEIYFTSGGTEADNWAILGSAELKGIGARHMISSLTEHDAVRKSADTLEDRGWEVSRLRPDSAGRITAEVLAPALRPDTALVSLMLVNNEMGAVNDIAALAKELKSANPRAVFHTDAVQALGKMPVNVKALGADLVTISSHKIGGPKGCGALWVRKGLNIKPLHYGGGQEKGLRPGTEALPSIAGFCTAAELAARE
ncbi:MAG: cysteine desulfurase, partial [Oscillospiraceae bacterium]|nr:cysteine desulfurase [Oscillospiraceae bacterium]